MRAYDQRKGAKSLGKGHSVHPLAAGGGFEPPTTYLKRGGLTGPQLLEGANFFRGLQFSHKQ